VARYSPRKRDHSSWLTVAVERGSLACQRSQSTAFGAAAAVKLAEISRIASRTETLAGFI
jgi:hypothetical protein